jgi:(p)ppGpp synthase/HD superfamily hydrolase
LHDTVEDTETTIEEIEQRFGARVRELVAALTDDKSLPRAERKALVLEHLKTADDSTKLVKLADLSSNIASFPSDWSIERQHSYLDWSKHAAKLCAGVSPALDALYESRCFATAMAIPIPD